MYDRRYGQEVNGMMEGIAVQHFPYKGLVLRHVFSVFPLSGTRNPWSWSAVEERDLVGWKNVRISYKDE